MGPQMHPGKDVATGREKVAVFFGQTTRKKEQWLQMICDGEQITS